MRSTCCALGIVGEYREQQFVVATGVASRQRETIGREGKIILK
jgi:hypothetical protein